MVNADGEPELSNVVIHTNIVTLLKNYSLSLNNFEQLSTLLTSMLKITTAIAQEQCEI